MLFSLTALMNLMTASFLVEGASGKRAYIGRWPAVAVVLMALLTILHIILLRHWLRDANRLVLVEPKPRSGLPLTIFIAISFGIFILVASHTKLVR